MNDENNAVNRSEVFSYPLSNMYFYSDGTEAFRGIRPPEWMYRGQIGGKLRWTKKENNDTKGGDA